MHVAYWSSVLPNSEKPTGILTYVKVMREAMVALGHRVTVLSPEGICLPSGDILPRQAPSGSAERLRQKVRGLFYDDPFSRFGAMIARARLREAHGLEPIDIFEVEESFGWAHHLQPSAPCPIVVRLHGPHFLVRDKAETDENRRLGDVREISEKRGIEAADAITGPSASVVARTMEYYGLAPAIVAAIPNPIEAASAGGCWSLDGVNPKHLLFVGRFDLCKGADILLDAFSKAHAIDPELELTMLGPDNGLAREDGSRIYFDDFVKARLSPAAAGRVRFMGTAPSSAVRAQRMACGPSLVLSRFENFPYSVAEGMALGTPMIVSDTDGAGEMIEDGVSGIVVPVEDVEATASAMLRITRDPVAAAAMGVKAYEKCARWLAPEKIAEETVALYERAIARRGRR